MVVVFSASCVYPNNLCIILCLHSTSAVMREIAVTIMNF